MSKTIWKFPIQIVDAQTLQMPRGAKILTVQVQGLYPTAVWAEVDPTAPLEPVFIEVFGTGHPMPEAERTYIGTVQHDGGALVWHIYQLHRLP